MENWNRKTIEAFRKDLLAWYDQEGRSTLPWRQNTDPYRILVSELMLQQTRVETVIDYFNRFMTALPTVQDLAAAPEDQVLKLWEGLGYYSRARNLHKAAKYVTNDLQGHWPESYDDLQSLPGVGPYTAAAIASIAFGQVVPAIDGNFFRVFSRLLKIDDDIAQPKSRKVFYQAIEPIVDPDRPGDFNQAIMDLGTTYMKTDNPDTVHSPVKKYNAAYRDGVEDQYPVKTKKKKPVRQLYQAQVTRDSQGRLLYEKRPDTGLLAGFWTFPLKEVQSIEDLQGEQLTVKPVVHIFSHRRWEIWLVAMPVEAGTDLAENQAWLSVDEQAALALPKVQHKLLKQLGEIDDVSK
ncbi:A/G-specific adenine glycosylase [Fructobacillus pseudoficulneus]|uniref:Adenine DNA glycosylase n=1 Tax=Fructobacillus pseudoficulneus TaxID=220714 RepID=A0A3F3H8L6_9LACO|nr:A/G-specific adenine glycosylase [Fructobacillus pseudoficulneus]GAP02929.1 A/G-specific adenine glycosylase [Fructobacillus pseudoficulneus]SEH45031.1 A/G-specific DNA-adenine glycosylase [Fructobacillus pseudoficulneus]